MKRLLFEIAIAVSAHTLLVPALHAASNASDNAADPAYNSGWTHGSNGGIGWGGAWIFNSFTQPTSYTTGSSTTNGNGDNGNPGGGTGGDGDIDTSGRAWGLLGGGTSVTTRAIRDFAGALNVGQSFNIQMDTGFVDTGSRQEFQLASFNGIFLQVFFPGGGNNYIVRDGTGDHDTLIPFTDEGLNITVLLTGVAQNGAQLYSISINVLDGAAFNFSGSMNLPAPNDSVRRVVLLNDAAPSAADHALFFNNMAIVPEPNTFALLALSAGVIVGLLRGKS